MVRPARIALLVGFLAVLAIAPAPTPAESPEGPDREAPAEGSSSGSELRALTDAEEPSEPDAHDVRPVWGDRFAVAGDSVVEAGEVRRGDYVSIGGTVRIDGTLRGTVTVIGGEVIVTGEVTRDVVAVFSAVDLQDGARVGGSVVNVLGSLDDRGASIRRDFIDIPLGLRWPGLEGPLQVLCGCGRSWCWWSSCSSESWCSRRSRPNGSTASRTRPRTARGSPSRSVSPRSCSASPRCCCS